jgi:hypothetical protein
MNYTNIELFKETIYKIAECAIENKLIYFLLGIVIFQEYAYTIKTERLYNNIYEALRRNEDSIYIEESDEEEEEEEESEEEESDEDDSSYVEEEESDEDDSSYVEEESDEDEDDSSYVEDDSIYVEESDEDDDSTKINNLEEKYAYLEDIINTIILNNENEEYKYDYNKLENETKYIENSSDGEDL